MRVTIDLDRDIIIIPDNFFKKIAEDNEKLEKYGAKPVKALDRIKKSFETAMADTDNRLLTQSNAKEKRTKKTSAQRWSTPLRCTDMTSSLHTARIFPREREFPSAERDAASSTLHTQQNY